MAAKELVNQEGLDRFLCWYEGYRRFGNDPIGLTTSMKDVNAVYRTWVELKKFGALIEKCQAAWRDVQGNDFQGE